MQESRRNSIEGSVVAAGAAISAGSSPLTAKTIESNGKGATTMPQQPAEQSSSRATEAVLGGRTFDPAKWVLVAPRIFEDLKVGEVFRMPSRTLTDANTSAFQSVSLDNNPLHYDEEYAKRHGLRARLVVPLEVLTFAVPGASLFTFGIAEVLIAWTKVTANYVGKCFVGDTLYSALEIAELTTRDNKGHVTMDITILNQHGEVVLTGQEFFELELTPGTR